MRRLPIFLATFTALISLGACGGSDGSDGDSFDSINGDAAQSSIPLENTTGDDSFEAETTAKILDEDDRMFLIVRAKPANTDSTMTPLLKATVDYGSGEASCEMFRDLVWSNSTSFQELTLECDTFPADEAVSATLVP